MNNEPVAWMQIHYKDKMCVTKLSPVKTWKDDIPLYTHPAETITLAELRQTDLYRKEQTRHLRELLEPKTLTDEEIADFEWAIKNVFNFSQSEKVVGLDNVIRAILRKASEK